MKMSYVLLISLLCGLGCSCSHSGRKLDLQRAIGNDYTAIMSAGGAATTVSSGAVMSRQIEGDSTRSEYVTFHAPPSLSCKEEVCTYIKVFFGDGKPALERSIPKGHPSVQVSWFELLRKEIFEITDRGLFSVSVETHYMDPKGEEREMYAEGVIFLRVVPKAYTSLETSHDDENYYWVWKSDSGQIIKLTTGARVFVEPRQSEL